MLNMQGIPPNSQKMIFENEVEEANGETWSAGIEKDSVSSAFQPEFHAIPEIQIEQHVKHKMSAERRWQQIRERGKGFEIIRTYSLLLCRHPRHIHFNHRSSMRGFELSLGNLAEDDGHGPINVHLTTAKVEEGHVLGRLL